MQSRAYANINVFGQTRRGHCSVSETSAAWDHKTTHFLALVCSFAQIRCTHTSPEPAASSNNYTKPLGAAQVLISVPRFCKHKTARDEQKPARRTPRTESINLLSRASLLLLRCFLITAHSSLHCKRATLQCAAVHKCRCTRGFKCRREQRNEGRALNTGKCFVVAGQRDGGTYCFTLIRMGFD
jgi:hypothetical protein